MAELDDPMWDEEPLLDSREYLYIHEIPRPATPHPHPQPIPATPTLQPDHGLPDTPPQQPNQVELSQELELMELDVLDAVSDFIDMPEDFEAWVHNVLSYQF